VTAQAALYYAILIIAEISEALNQYQKFLETQTGDVSLYMILAECHQTNQYEETIKTYQEGIKLPKLFTFVGLALQDFGRTQEAIAVLTEASLYRIV